MTSFIGRQSSRSDYLIYAAMGVVHFALGLGYVSALPIQLGADAGQNIEIANALLGREGELYYYRSWGYPLFLILTGFPWLQDPKFVLWAQLALGSAVPFLVGSALRRLGAASGFCLLGATLSLLSLSPLVLAHSLLSDQVSQFLLYLVIWLVAISLARVERGTVSNRALWKYGGAISLVFFSLYLMRQANAFLGPAALLAASLVGSNAYRKLALRAIVALVALTALWVPVQMAWVSWSEAAIHRSFKHKQGSLAGAMFFWNVYGSGATFAGRSTIDKSNGPCSQTLYEALQRHAVSVLPSRVTADEALAQHTLVNHYVIWKSLEADLGPERMDNIFWCAAFEGINAEPKSLLYYLDGLVAFFLVSDVIYNDGYRQAWPSISYYAAAIPQTLGAWALYVGTGIKIVAFLIALMTFVPTYQAGGARRVFAASLWAMLLYLALVHVVFAAPHWRYTLVVVPGLVLLAALGLSGGRRQTCPHGTS